MSYEDFKDPFYSLTLFGHSRYLNELNTLYINKKLPKVTMLSGNKGSGKFTLIFHFLNYIFDKDNYNSKLLQISPSSNFYKNILNNTFQNFVYIGGKQKVGIIDIRDLKEKVSMSTINSFPRFIILDDVELLNLNSSNALLKITEEPSENNYFILINNLQKKISETISSRCIKKRIFLNNTERKEIINKLISHYSINPVIDPNTNLLTPGAFLIFNDIATENNISKDLSYLDKISVLLNLYKKKKDINYINLSIFYTDYYFYKVSNNYNNLLDLNNAKISILKHINNYVSLNLNITSVLNNINSHFYGK